MQFIVQVITIIMWKDKVPRLSTTTNGQLAFREYMQNFPKLLWTVVMLWGVLEDCKNRSSSVRSGSYSGLCRYET